MHPAGGTHLVEQPAPTDRLELAGVADQRQPPAVRLGELDELVERAGADHPGLIDDQGRPGGEPVAGVRWPVGAVPFVEELGDGVAVHPGLTFEDPGGFGGGGDTEHRPVPGRQVLHGPLQRGGLAGAGRADDHHETVGAGDRRGGVGLEHVESVPLDGGRRRRFVGWASIAQASTRSSSARIASLVMCGCGWLQPDRAAIRHPAAEALAGGVEVDAVVDHPVTGPFEGRRPAAPGIWDMAGGGHRSPAGRRAGPGRPGGGEVIDHLPDGHRGAAAGRPRGSARCGDHVAGSSRALRLRPATVSPDPRHGARLAARVSADASRSSAARSQRLGSRPCRRRNSSTFTANAASTCCGPLREHLQQLGRHAGDLGLAVDDRLPADPVAMGQLGAQHRLVQAAQHPLVAFQVAGIQRPPPTVLGLHLRVMTAWVCSCGSSARDVV